MNATPDGSRQGSREHLVHALYEAAELEHNLMCTYLYAAFSLKQGVQEGLTPQQAEAVQRWRQTIMQVAIEEMAHLGAVWNITAALGAAPRFGRMNFPLDAGYLPAGIVVKLAPFNAATLQHFIFLERPQDSQEAEGEGFSPERWFARGNPAARLTPMSLDYDTVGVFYRSLEQGLSNLVEKLGESAVFCGDPALQMTGAAVGLPQVRPVICLKTALAALDSIVRQGEGAPAELANSHFEAFVGIRREFDALRSGDPDFAPAFPAATNPVLRRPPRPEGRVWLENPRAVATVDLANASYGLMLRLLAYSYALPGTQPGKGLANELAIGLMRSLTLLGMEAARLPAGPAHPECHAGVSFTSLRDAAALPAGTAAESFFVERLDEFAAEAASLDWSERTRKAGQQFAALARRARASWSPTAAPTARPPSTAAQETPAAGPAADLEVVDGKSIQISFQGKRCIHARFCVTGAPKVFLANVQGPWIHPDSMPLERLVEVAHACPSGAIQYTRRDGGPPEAAPPVNLAAVREAGPYAFRGALILSGKPAGFRATLCRCGASKNKPYCDGTHHEAGFSASGEPPVGTTDMLPVRDGALAIDPEPHGPLVVSGNLEITSGTGRVVARLTAGRLCRCGGSQSKPFCDGTHARIGFRAP